MSEIKTIKMEKNIGHDIWFHGAANKTESGADTYFICQYLNKNYYDEEANEFYTYCMEKKMRVDDPTEVCHMGCDQFGRCETCAGFSAVRCQECEIPRP